METQCDLLNGLLNIQTRRTFSRHVFFLSPARVLTCCTVLAQRNERGFSAFAARGTAAAAASQCFFPAFMQSKNCSHPPRYAASSASFLYLEMTRRVCCPEHLRRPESHALLASSNELLQWRRADLRWMTLWLTLTGILSRVAGKRPASRVDRERDGGRGRGSDDRGRLRERRRGGLTKRRMLKKSERQRSGMSQIGRGGSNDRHLDGGGERWRWWMRRPLPLKNIPRGAVLRHRV